LALAAAVPALTPTPAQAWWHGAGWHPGWGWHAGFGWHPWGWHAGWGWRGGVYIGAPAVVVGAPAYGYRWIPGHWAPGGFWVAPHWGYY
jgi:hypothetical protein